MKLTYLEMNEIIEGRFAELMEALGDTDPGDVDTVGIADDYLWLESIVEAKSKLDEAIEYQLGLAREYVGEEKAKHEEKVAALE